MCKNKSGKQQSPSNSHSIECQDNITVESYKQNAKKGGFYEALCQLKAVFCCDLFPSSHSAPA